MKRKNGLILVLLLLILVVEIVIVAPEEVGFNPDAELNAPPPTAGSAPRRSQEMQGVHLVGAKGEEREWELWANTAVREKENSDWEIQQVRVKFYGENGVTYVVTGDKGRVINEKNIRVEGNVLTRSSNGYVFKTDTIDYNSTERTLRSPNTVSMVGPKDPEGSQLSLTGEDMLAEMQSNDIWVHRNVKARKKIKDGKIATIISQKANFSGKSNYAKFIGNVIIDVETLRIAGPEAQFNYKAGTDIIDSMVVSGGVRVTDLDKWATSDRVRVQFDEEKFTFNGSPRVVQNGDELRGEEIVFLKGGKQVQVLKARARMESNPVAPRNAETQVE